MRLFGACADTRFRTIIIAFEEWVSTLAIQLSLIILDSIAEIIARFKLFQVLVISSQFATSFLKAHAVI